MLFDDRLGTVLRQPPGSEAIARIQFRQLLDLLGTLPSEANGPQVDAAYDRLAALSSSVPASARASMVQDPGLRLRSARLVAVLASAEPTVASAAIARAELETEQWLDLAPALPLHARGLMRERRDLGAVVDRQLGRLGIRDRGLPLPEGMEIAPQAQADAAPEPIAPASVAPAKPIPAPLPGPRPEGIGDIVRRIERFRQARERVEPEPNGDSPRLPLEEQLGLTPSSALRGFDFATDAEGRISWAEGSAAPMAFGLRLASGDPLGPVAASSALVLAFRRRQPIRAATLEIAGAPAISGAWRIDAAPLFDPMSGSFTGYAGRMRRPAPPADADMAPVPPQGDDADRMRQLLHELRTPVNAIQGFAEVIQQQLFGPSPHEYRALAAAIAGDAARMLAGFDELDRLARLDSGAHEMELGESDLVVVFSETAQRLQGFAAARDGGFELRVEDATLPVALTQGDAERLAWRLLATLAGAAAPGETLRLRLRRRGAEARVSLDLPASLAQSEGEAIFLPAVPTTPPALSAGMFGTGFALRLARSEVGAAGGSLERRRARLRLALPLLTAAHQAAHHPTGPHLTADAQDNSQTQAGGG
ncbi:MAG TPA: histidine kinase dimerization/phospho-acceptor domain-containing protein [Novosphingobium sp.]